MKSFFAKLKYWDGTLAVICFLLLLMGLTLIYSTSLNGDKGTFYKQLIYAGIGIVLFMFFAYVDVKALAKSIRYLYVLLFILLLAILKFGQDIQGSRRWFDLKFFHFQPAEFMKIVLILLLARFFALRRGEIRSWKNIILSFIYVFLPAILIAREPDLGSAIILLIIWFGVLLLSNVEKKTFVYLFLFFVIFASFSWTYVFKDYQKNRIEIFMDPSLDPQGRGYNVQQAIISVGSGGFWGTGLGRGLQSQLRFLPERQTDFIFASASEELGFLGASVILVLYFILLYRLLVIYKNCPDDLGRFAIAGIFFMVFGQVVINIGMNIGILPVTGIPLPFISYGGSSLLTLAISMGISQAVAIRSQGLRLK
jgi:rod shape determining protein RodA